MSVKGRLKRAAAVAAAVGGWAAAAWAWHGAGHALAVRQAIAALSKDQVPAFLLEGAGLIVHCSGDPDGFTRPIAGPVLHNAESPEHYFDVELADPNSLPPRRYDFLAACAARKLDPRKVGLLPYAVAEWSGRLTVAFAEHRRWPEDPYIRQKCLVYAGILAHYAADLCQPLHTTVHYDGRLSPDGNSPRSGIHLKVDAILGKLAPDANAPPAGAEPVAYDDVLAAAVKELLVSHALVAEVYRLEDDLPAYEQPLDANSPAGRFARERLRACARFTASLYVTAWRDSQAIRLPEWHRREASESSQGHEDPSRNVEARNPKSETAAKCE